MTTFQPWHTAAVKKVPAQVKMTKNYLLINKVGAHHEMLRCHCENQPKVFSHNFNSSVSHISLNYKDDNQTIMI